MNRKGVLLVYWCIFFYFMLLFVERTFSLMRSFMDDSFSPFSSVFSTYVYCAVFVSLGAFLILLIALNRYYLAALFTGDIDEINRVSIKRLSVLIGVILVSGMVHTYYTVVWLQFIAYGFLIVGLIIANVIYIPSVKSKFSSWNKLLYVIAYSMAIPVVYESKLPYALAFHIVEAVASLVLIGIFTFMTYCILTGKTSKVMMVEFFHIALFLNIAIVWMRWTEEINYFIMVSMGVALVLWLIEHYYHRGSVPVKVL